jgi:3-deoxy-manno-octulosonate cytidylyltransferase (CMP-KDO synthetase)
MSIVGIIPARYASTRFPGKPLADINGTSMIRRVYEQACQAKSLNEVWVATDDQRIFDHVNDFGGRVMMTSTEHTTGTERCHEVSGRLEQEGRIFEIVINIQGDEPYIDPLQIDQVAACFSRQEVQIATLIKKISREDQLFHPGTIKVVINRSGRAIYFSRSAIPFCRSSEIQNWPSVNTYYKHIGIYAYKTEVLKKIVKLDPTPLELAESLEQLRWLENGYDIYVSQTEFESHSVDTPDDLKKMISG